MLNKGYLQAKTDKASDEVYTARYAVIPIEKYLKPNSTIWCPFDMEDSEYETLLKEFDVILKQMDKIGEIEEIKGVEPMTFPFLRDDIELRSGEEVENIDRDILLSNCHNKLDNRVKVPKVVE